MLGRKRNLKLILRLSEARVALARGGRAMIRSRFYVAACGLGAAVLGGLLFIGHERQPQVSSVDGMTVSNRLASAQANEIDKTSRTMVGPPAPAIGEAILAGIEPSPATPDPIDDQPPRAGEGRRSTRFEGFSQADDQYQNGGAMIPLLRSVKRVSVSVADGESQALQALEMSAQTAGFKVVQRGDRHGYLVLEAGDAMEMDAVLPHAAGLPGVVYADWVYATADQASPVIVTPNLVVKFRNPTTEEEARQYCAAHGLTLVRGLRGLPQCFVVRVATPLAGLSVLKIAAQRGLDPEVAWVQPDFITEAKKLFTPNDPFYPQQWHLAQRANVGGNTNASVHADAAWDITRGSNTIIIAIIDDSMDWRHPDLTNNVFVNASEYGGGKETNRVDDDGNGYIDDWHGWDFFGDDNDPSPNIGNNHGTSCAGLAAGTGNNGIGISGVAPGCRLLPIRRDFDGGSPDSVVAEMIAYAATTARVISCSWEQGTPAEVIDDSIRNATINGCGGKGCAVLFSSGNSGGSVRYPAKLPECIAVGGSSLNDRRVYYSSFGPELDVVAPTMGEHAGMWTTDDVGAAAGYNQLLGWSNYVYSMVSGVHTVEWRYVKNSNGDYGWDSAWIDNIVLPGMGTETFESGGLSGFSWQTGGDTPPAVNTLKPFAGNYSVRFGDILDNQTSFLRLVGIFSAGTLSFEHYVSSEGGGDLLYLYIDGVAVTTISGLNGDELGDYTDGFSGTSAACPVAAGVAALVLSRYPNLTSAQVRQALQQSADKIGTNLYVNGRNDPHGYGRVNAHRALGGAGPVIISTPSRSAAPSVPYHYDGNDAAEAIGSGSWTWSAVSAPPGFGIHPTSGVVSWTPASGAATTITIRASNSQGTNEQVWTVNDIPELQMTAVSGPAFAGIGATLSITNTVTNTSAFAAGTFAVGVYLSLDTTITTGDTLIATRPVYSLAGHAGSRVATPCPVPTNLSPNTYYLGVIADYDGSQLESNEVNNALAGGVIQVGLSDLRMTEAVGSAVAGIRGNFGVTNTVTNSTVYGAGTFQIGVYLSPDATITTGDTRIATRSLSGLAGNAGSRVMTSCTVPTNLSPNTYYLGVIADYAGQQPESNEGNNALAGGAIQVGLSDLQMTEVTGPAVAVIGTTIRLTNTVANPTVYGAGAFNIGIYLSTDATITTGDTLLVTSFVSSLAGNGSSRDAPYCWISNGLAPNLYYLGAIADYLGQQPESNEGNNSLAGTQIQLEQRLDHFDWATIPDPQLPNTPFAVRITAQDAGNYTVAGFSGIVALFAGQELLADDVEGGNNAWTHSGTGDLWHVSTYRSSSPTRAWCCNSEATHRYENGMDCSLIGPTRVLGTGGKLTFQHWYSTSGSGDHGDVEVSTNNGATYSPLATFKGSGSSWRGHTNDLSAYAGQPVKIRFRFISDGATTAEGWYLDDIRLISAGGVALLPTHSGNFVGGVWTGSVSVQGSASNVLLYADDGAGHGGTSGAFDVQPSSDEDRPEVLDDGSFGVISNRFGFNLNGTSGKVVVVDACTNLIHPVWLPLQTNTLDGTPTYFIDPRWTNFIRRYYRIRAP